MLPNLLKGIHIDWYNKNIFLVTLLISSLIFYVSLTKGDFSTVNIQLLIFTIIIDLLLYWVWSKTVLPTKTKKGKIGFVIAIKTENEAQESIINNDVIFNINTILSETSNTQKFHVFPLQKWHANKIQGKEDAIKYLKKCDATLLLQGQFSKRKQGKEYYYTLRLTQTVLHNEISQNISDKMSIELGKIFLPKVAIKENDEILGIERTTGLLAEAAKYFVAVAATINKNLIISESLFFEIKNSAFLKTHKFNPTAKQLRRMANENLYNISSYKARAAYDKWLFTSNKNEIQIIGEELDKQVTYKGKSIKKYYNWMLLKAIWLVIWCGKNDDAIKILLQCKPINHAAWRYSLAFLYACEGDLKKAVYYYDSAFIRSAGQDLSLNVEIYIAWKIKEEPNNYQLYFCLGYINYKFKEDYDSAIIDLTKFISNEHSRDEFPDEYEKANIYINKMKT